MKYNCVSRKSLNSYISEEIIKKAIYNNNLKGDYIDIALKKSNYFLTIFSILHALINSV